MESFWRRVGERKKMSNEDQEMCRRADDESRTVGGVLPSAEVQYKERREGLQTKWRRSKVPICLLALPAAGVGAGRLVLLPKRDWSNKRAWDLGQIQSSEECGKH